MKVDTEDSLLYVVFHVEHKFFSGSKVSQVKLHNYFWLLGWQRAVKMWTIVVVVGVGDAKYLSSVRFQNSLSTRRMIELMTKSRFGVTHRTRKMDKLIQFSRIMHRQKKKKII